MGKRIIINKKLFLLLHSQIQIYKPCIEKNCNFNSFLQFLFVSILTEIILSSFNREQLGHHFNSNNGTLLDRVIEQSTGLSLNAFANQTIKPITGITGAFVKLENNNVFFSNARSMARFGLLILNNGSWAQNRIMTDTDYFHQMVNSSQIFNESYGYLWWLNGKPSYMVPGLQSVNLGICKRVEL